MRTSASLLAIRASLLWLVVWMATASLAVALPWTRGTAFLLTRPWQTLLPAFGFAGMMIFGMTYHFLPVFSDRPLALPRVALGQVLVANVALLLLLVSPLLPGRVAAILGYGAWLLCALAAATVLMATTRQPRRGRRTHATPHPSDRMALPLTLATPFYLNASAVVLLWSALPVPSAPTFASGLHLFTTGFILLTVFGVALHLLPRFSGGTPSSTLARLLVATALPAPAGIAWFISRGGPGFPLFAILGAAASACFVAILVQLRLQSPRPRPFYRFYLAAGASLLLGVGLGVLFALLPAARVYVHLHLLLNLFGFAGLMILGVTHEVLPPYADRGYAASLRAGRLHLAGGGSGLALALLGRLPPLPGGSWMALAGHGLLLATVLSYAAGTARTLRVATPRDPGRRAAFIREAT